MGEFIGSKMFIHRLDAPLNTSSSSVNTHLQAAANSQTESNQEAHVDAPVMTSVSLYTEEVGILLLFKIILQFRSWTVVTFWMRVRIGQKLLTRTFFGDSQYFNNHKLSVFPPLSCV